MENKKVTNYIMRISVYVVGLLSVIIAGLLGGYYCFGAAIVAVISTIFVYKCFDNNCVKENLIDLACMSVILAFQVLFFFVNDVLNIVVYDKNNLNFLGYIVMASQVYSAIMIGYYIIKITLDNIRKEKVVYKKENDNRDFDVIDTKIETNTNNEVKVEIKAIGERNVIKEAPFMEEQK